MTVIDRTRRSLFVSTLQSFVDINNVIKYETDSDTNLFTGSGRPKSQGMILSASMGIFFLYFFVLREENDVDERLGLSMLESVNFLVCGLLRIPILDLQIDRKSKVHLS